MLIDRELRVLLLFLVVVFLGREEKHRFNLYRDKGQVLYVRSLELKLDTLCGYN